MARDRHCLEKAVPRNGDRGGLRLKTRAWVLCRLEQDGCLEAREGGD